MISGENRATRQGETSPRRCHVTLVHGTFARGAVWTQDDSRLAQAVKGGLGGPVAVDRCEWSGGSTAGAREAGARTLAAHVRAIGARDPDVPQFVIAHSHGGNVALYALRDPDVARHVRGVVCMATPFLVARPRDLGPKGRENLLLAVLVALLAVYYLWLAEPVAAALPWLPSGVGTALFLVVTAATIGLLYVRWNAMAERLLEQLTLPELPSEKLLILRATGDEASALLLFFQFLSLLLVRLFHLLQRLYGWVERHFTAWSSRKLALIGAIVAAVLGSAVAGAFLTRVTAAGDSMFPLVLAVLLLGAFTLAMSLLLLIGWIGPATALFRLAASIPLLPAALVIAVCMLPTDWRIAVANLLIDVTPEPTPAGAWQIHQLVPRPSAGAGPAVPGLAHSAIYDDDEALREIVGWITRRRGEWLSRA
jgi:hypothetical protein